MSSKFYKYCIVPQCGSTTIKTPNKLFIYVPNNEKIRQKWLNLANRDPEFLSNDSRMYFCEDHFDLPNDMENYMEYHIMGSVLKIRLKAGCIPSKFECHAHITKRTYSDNGRPYSLKKRRIMPIEKCISESVQSKVCALRAVLQASH